jgi:hypothetical protein
VALGNTPRRETNIAVEASKSYVLGMRFIQQVNEDASDPVDLTGCTLRFVATEPPQRGSTEVLNLIAEMDQPESGLAQFKFQAADLTLEPTQYAYDVTLIPPSGYSTPILKGYLEIGSNTDLDDSNVYGQLNVTSDITVTWGQGDNITIEIERVDGMFLVVSALIEEFAVDMQEQVDKAAASAQASLNSANLSASYAQSMQVWLDNAGYPFWKGTQAQYDSIQKKGEFLYLITDEAVAP